MIICIRWKAFLTVMCQTTSNCHKTLWNSFPREKEPNINNWILKIVNVTFGAHTLVPPSSMFDFDIYSFYILFRANVLVPSQFIFLEISALNWRFQVYFIKNISLRISKSQGHRVSLSKKKKNASNNLFLLFLGAPCKWLCEKK